MPTGADAVLHTSLDGKLQSVAEIKLAALLDGPGATAGVGQGAVVALDAATGAVRAMETDINYEWVTFISYAAPNGHMPTKLLGGIDHGGTRYLVPDDRDFFAVIARSPVTWKHG